VIPVRGCGVGVVGSCIENEAKKLFGELMLTFKTELELISEH
jgi:hypothetical protein